ncbi:hypothetical protein [Altererythrobacter sp.]|uniref:hypothetical protein n=1 Tax=Altererythrobacter sp. TaxID=1872480 RepID=UPI001B2626B3|nr:hypothetical protein [Altererythrobacter sp.]MBO6608525.1 hypothetical protein [Altererythrobacter sp.]MBO6641960.1 hypothetical protein [Altererythrobacter sp.]MBO6709532.1 hypothetical protein [Altererythrobacter sp.]MBO6944361.1 hypothetical protein [Altererythrobacter sp.]
MSKLNSKSSIDGQVVENDTDGHENLLLAIQEMESALKRLDCGGHLICAAELSRAIESAKAHVLSE